jgi:hypothetical protein
VKITLEWLKEKRACLDAQTAFKVRFGQEADYQEILNALGEPGQKTYCLESIRLRRDYANDQKSKIL